MEFLGEMIVLKLITLILRQQNTSKILQIIHKKQTFQIIYKIIFNKIDFYDNNYLKTVNNLNNLHNNLHFTITSIK
jgi:hypothetical protein